MLLFILFIILLVLVDISEKSAARNKALYDELNKYERDEDWIE